MRRAATEARLPRALAAGVDTGGTFTDVIARVAGGLVVYKVPSTPDAPGRAVLAGLAAVGAGRGTPVRHGSTVATNALLERRGARVAFVTTAGFEDVIEIGRQARPDILARVPIGPAPLVPRALRIGVAERRDERGAVQAPLTEAELRRVRARVLAARPEAIAIGLLHAWASPAHERRLERALRSLGLPLTRSSGLCPEIREYERFATTAANAFLMPLVGRYLQSIGREYPDLEVVLSHGGTAPRPRAAREPVRQLLSGPAAGLRAARDAARACGFTRALACDVGGTSTDAAFLCGRDAGPDGLPRRRARTVAGVPLLVPALDVQTVGAGGGSIAQVDAGGLLRVGPRSAGADPGPAAYGAGGPATLTDALLVLGRLPAEPLAGGALALDPGAARRALAGLAARLRRPIELAAEGVVRVAEGHMEAALRSISLAAGEDPRGAVLVAYGGAGGLHACALADALRAPAVLWPRHAGGLCALGALTGGSRRERARSCHLPVRARGAWQRALARLAREVRAEIPTVARRTLRLESRALLRYRGQAHELDLEVTADLEARFHAAHARRFGFANADAEVEIVTLEVRAATRAIVPRDSLPRRRALAAPRSARAWIAGRWRATAQWWRDDLPRNGSIRGPALVRDAGATLWVAPGWRARWQHGHVVLGRGRRP